MEQTGYSTNTDPVLKQKRGSEREGLCCKCRRHRRRCQEGAVSEGGGFGCVNLTFGTWILAGLVGELNAASIWLIWGQCLALVKIFQGVVLTLFSCKNAKALKIALLGYIFCPKMPEISLRDNENWKENIAAFLKVPAELQLRVTAKIFYTQLAV